MTVKDLVLELQRLDPNALVVMTEDDVTEPCEFVALDTIVKEN